MSTETAELEVRTSVLDSFIVIEDGAHRYFVDLPNRPILGDDGQTIIGTLVQAVEDFNLPDEENWVRLEFENDGTANEIVEFIVSKDRTIELDLTLNIATRDGLDSINAIVTTDEPGVVISGVDQPFNFWGADDDEDGNN